MSKILYSILLVFLIYSGAQAHSIHYQVEKKASAQGYFILPMSLQAIQSMRYSDQAIKFPIKKAGQIKTVFSHFCPTAREPGLSRSLANPTTAITESR
jgi:hypothetical protein